MSYVDQSASGVKGVSTNVGYSTVEQSHNVQSYTVPGQTYSESYQYTSQPVTTTTTHQYTSPTYTTTNVVGNTGYASGYSGSNYVGNSNIVGGTSHVVGGASHVVGGASHVVGGASLHHTGAHQRAVAEDIPVESRI